MSILATILVSFFISTIIVLFFRKIDKTGRTFNKLSKLSKTLERKLSALAEEKYQALKDFDNCIEVSIDKGHSLLGEMNSSITDLEDKYSKVESQKEKITLLYKKIDMVDREIESISDQVRDINESYDFVKGVDEKLVKFRKELALQERDITRVQDTFRKENSASLKEIAKKVVKETEGNVKSIKNELKNTKERIEKYRLTIFERLNGYGNEIHDKMAAHRDTYEHFIEEHESAFDSHVERCNNELAKISSTISTLKGDFFQNVNEHLRAVHNEISSKITEYKEQILTEKDSIEEYFDDKSSYFFESFAGIKEKIDNLNNQAVNELSLNKDEIIGELNSRFEAVSKDLKEQMDALYGAAEAAESQVLDSLSGKLTDFSGKVEADITSSYEMIDGKIENSKEQMTVLSDDITSLQGNVEKMTSLINEEIEDANIRYENLRNTILLEIDKYKEIAYKNLIDIKAYFKNEKEVFFSEVKISLDTMRSDADEKGLKISEQFEDLYDRFEDKLNDIQDSLYERAEKIETKVNRQTDEIEESLKGYKESARDNVIEKFNEVKVQLEDQQVVLKDEIEDLIGEFNGKVESFRQEVDELLSGSSSEVQEKVDVFKEELEYQFAGIKEKYNGYISSLEEKSDDVEHEYNERVSSFEDKIASLADRTEHVTDYLEKIDGKYDDKLAEKYRQIEERFLEKNNKLYEDNANRLLEFNGKFNDLNSRLYDINSRIEHEAKDKADRGIRELGDSFEKSRRDIEEKFSGLEEEVTGRLEKLSESAREIVSNYKVELSRVRENIQSIDSSYDYRLQEKYEEIDSKLTGVMKEFNDTVGTIKAMRDRYSSKLIYFEDKVKEIEVDVTDKLENIAAEYSQRGDAIFSEKSDLLQGISTRFNELGRSMEDMQKSLEGDLDSMIEEGKSTIDLMLQEGNEQVGEKIRLLEEDAVSRIQSYKQETEHLSEVVRSLEDVFNQKLEKLFSSADASVSDQVHKLNSEYAEEIQRVKSSIVSFEEAFQDRTLSIEKYYKEQSTRLLNEKIAYIDGLEVKLGGLSRKVEEYSSDLETSIFDKIESGKGELETLFSAGRTSIEEQYRQLEKDMVDNIESYRRDLKKIRHNIKVIDDKFTGKFLQKLKDADHALSDKLSQLSGRYLSIIEEYKEQYAGKLNEAETMYAERQDTLFEKSNQELDSYSERIKGLVDRISEVKRVIDEEVDNKLEQGRKDLSALFDMEKERFSTEYRKMSDQVQMLIKGYRGQILRIKKGIVSIDAKMQQKLTEKLGTADLRIDRELEEISLKYGDSVRELHDKVAGLETGFARRLDDLAGISREKNEELYNEHYRKLVEFSGNIGELTAEYNQIKERMNSELEERFAAGKADLVALKEKITREVLSEIEEHREDFTAFLAGCRVDIDTLGQDIIRVEEHIKGELNEKLDQLENRTDSGLEEICDRYEESVKELENQYTQVQKSLHTRLDEAEAHYRARGETAIREQGDALAAIVGSSRVLKNSLRELEERFDSEIKEKISTSLAQVDTLLEAGSRRVKDVLSDFSKISEDKISSFKEEFSKLRSRISDVERNYDNRLNDKLGRSDRIFNDRLNSLNQVLSDLESEYKERLDELEELYRDRGEAALDGQQVKINDFMNKFSMLQNQLELFKNRFDSQVSRKIASGLETVDAMLEKNRLDVAAKLEEFKHEAGLGIQAYKDELHTLRSKIGETEKTYGDLLSESVKAADKTINEKVVILTEGISALESEYKEHLAELEKANIRKQDQLEAAQSEKITLFMDKVHDLQTELDGIKTSFDTEIASKIASGLETVDAMLEENRLDVAAKLSEFQQEAGMGINIYKEDLLTLRKRLADAEVSYGESLSGTLKAAEKSINEKVVDLTGGLSGLESEYKEHLAELEKAALQKQDQLEETQSEKITLFMDKVHDLRSELDGIKTSFDTEIASKIASGLETVDAMLEENRLDVAAKLSEFQQEAGMGINVYKEDLLTLRKRLSDAEVSYGESLSGTLKAAEKSINEKVLNLTSGLTGLESEYKEHLAELEKAALQKQDQLEAAQSAKLELFTDKVHDLQTELDGIKTSFDTEIASKITSGLETVDAMLEENRLGVAKDIEDFRIEADRKIGAYKNELQLMSTRLKEAESQYKGSLFDSLNSADQAFQEKLTNLFSEVEKVEHELSARSDETLREQQHNYEGYKNWFNRIEKQMGELKEKLEDNFSESLAQGLASFEQILGEGKESILEKLSGFEKENLVLLEGYKEDIQAIKQKYNEIEAEVSAGFTDKLNGFDTILTGKIDNIEGVLADVERDFKEKISTIRGEYQAENEQVFRENAAKLGGFKDRFGKLQQQIAEVKRTVEEDVEQKIKTGLKQLDDAVLEREETITGKLNLLEADMIRRIGQLSENARQVIDSTRSELSNMQEELQNFDTQYDLKLEEKYREIDGVLNKKLENVDSIVDEMNEIGKRYSSRFEAFEDKASGLEEYIGDRIDGYRSELESLEDQIESIRREISDGLEEKIYSVKSELKEAADGLFSRYEENRNELDDKYRQLTNDFEVRFVDLEKGYDDRNQALYDENIAKYEEFTSRFGTLNSQLVILKKKVLSELEELKARMAGKIEAGLSEALGNVDTAAEEKKAQILGRYQEFEHESINTINSYKDEIGLLKESISAMRGEMDNKFEEKIGTIDTMMAEKIGELYNHIGDIENDFDTRFEDKMAGTDKTLKEKLEAIYSSAVSIEKSFTGKIGEIEHEFSAKNSELYEHNIQKMQEFSGRFTALNDKLLKLKNRIDDEVSEKIDEGVQVIRKTLSEKEKDIMQEFESVESEVTGRLNDLAQNARDIAGNYKIELSQVRENIRNIDSSYSARLQEKYDEIDGKLTGVMKEFNDTVDTMQAVSSKYAGRLQGFEKSVKDIEESCLQRLDALIADYSKRGDAVFSEKSDLLKGITGRFNELSDSMERIKNSFEGDIDNVITEGKGAIDRMLTEGSLAAGERIKSLEEDAVARIESYKEETEHLSEVVSELEERFNSKIRVLFAGADTRVSEQVEKLNSDYAREIEQVKKSIMAIEDAFKERTGSIEKYYKDQSTRLLNEKITYINSLNKKLSTMSGQLEGFGKELETTISDSVASGKSEIEQVLGRGVLNIEEQYKLLEADTTRNIERYRDDLKKIRHNIKVIDDKFTGKFLQKMKDADKELAEQLSSLSSRYLTLIEEYKEQYAKHLDDAEEKYKDKQKTLFDDRNDELDSYRGRIEELAHKMEDVKRIIDEEVDIRLAEGKKDLTELFEAEKERFGTEYKTMQSQVQLLINGYKGQIDKIKSGVSSIYTKLDAKLDAKMQDRLKEKLSSADRIIDTRLESMEGKYRENLQALQDKTVRLEEGFKNRIEKLAGISKDKNEELYNEHYNRLVDYSRKIGDLTTEYNTLRGRMDTEIEEQVEFGKAALTAYKEELVEQARIELEEKKSDYQAFVAGCRDEADLVKTELTRMEELVKGPLSERFTNLEKMADENILEITSRYSDAVTELENEYGKVAGELTSQLDLLEKDYRSRGDAAVEESSARLSELMASCRMLSADLANLEQKMETEINSRVEISLNDASSSFQEHVRGLEDDFKMRLETLENTNRETSEKIYNRHNEEIDTISDKIGDLNGEFDRLKARMDSEIEEQVEWGRISLTEHKEKLEDEILTLVSGEKTDLDAFIQRCRSQIKDFAGQLDRVEERIDGELSGKISDLDSKADENQTRIREDYRASVNSLEDEYKSISRELGSQLDALEEAYRARGNEAVEENKTRLTQLLTSYNELTGKLHKLEEQLDKGVSARIETSLSRVDTMLTEHTDKVAGILEQFSAESEKNIAVYKDELTLLRSRLTDFEKGYKGRLTDKMEHTDRTFGSKLDSLRDTLSALETEYREKLSSIEDDYRERGETALTSQEQEMSRFLSKFDTLKLDFEEARKNMETGFRESMEAGLETISRQIEEQGSTLSARYADFEETQQEKIEQIGQVMEQVKERFAGLQQRLDRGIEENMGHFDTTVKERISGVANTINELENEFNTRLLAMETEYDSRLTGREEKSSALLEENFDKIREVGLQVVRISSQVDGLEEQIAREFDERMASGLKNLERVIDEKIENLMENYNQIETDTIARIQGYRDQLAAINSAISAVDTDFENRYSRKMEDVDSRFETSLFDMRERLENAENSFVEKLVKIQESYAQEQESIKQEAVDSLDGLENQIGSLENLLRDTLDNADEKLQGKLSGALEKMDSLLAGKQDEFNASMELFEQQTADKIKAYKDELEGIKQNIRWLNENFQYKYEEKLDETEAELKEQVASLNAELEKVEYNFKDRLDRLENSYSTKSKDDFEKTMGELDLVRNDFHSLTDRIDSIKEHLDTEVARTVTEGKENVARILEEGEKELDKKITHFDKMTDNKLEQFNRKLGEIQDSIQLMQSAFDTSYKEATGALDQKLKLKYEEIVDDYNSSVLELKSKLSFIEKDFREKTASLDGEYRQRSEDVYSRNKEQYASFVDEYQLLSKKINDIKDNINIEVEKQLFNGLNKIENLLEGGGKQLEGHYSKVEEEALLNIDTFKKELAAVQDSMGSLDRKYEQVFSNKLIEIDDRFLAKFDKVQDDHEKVIAQSQHHITIMEKGFEDELERMKKDFDISQQALIDESDRKLSGFTSRFDDLNKKLDALTLIINDEVEIKIEQGKDELELMLVEQINQMRDIYSRTDKELFEKLKSYSDEFSRVSKDIARMDDKFTARFMDRSSVLDKRLADMEDNLFKIEKQTKNIDKAQHVYDKLNDDMKSMKEYIQAVKKDKKEIENIEEKIGQFENIFKASESRYQALMEESKNIDNMVEAVGQLREVTAHVEDKIQTIKSAKLTLAQMENNIGLVNKKCKDIDGYMEKLELKEQGLIAVLKNVELQNENSSRLEGRIEGLSRTINDMEIKRDSFEKGLKRFEHEAGFIIQSEQKIDDVVSRFKQMDSLVEDLELRTDSIIKIREWLVRAETQIENLNYETDKRIKLLQSLLDQNTAPDVISEHAGDDASRKQLILKLQAQGWTIDDIAKTLNLSIGEVEFILDLELSKKRN